MFQLREGLSNGARTAWSSATKRRSRRSSRRNEAVKALYSVRCGIGVAATQGVARPSPHRKAFHEPRRRRQHKAKMMKRKAAQDAEVAAKPILRERSPHRPYRSGQRQVDSSFRTRVAGAWPWPSRWGGAVHQGRVVDRRAHGHRALRRPGRVAHDGRGLHLGDAGPRARCRGGERRLG